MEALSTKEMEVWKHVAVGMNNKQIAEKMCITTDTVKAHLTSVMRKLNVSNRTSAAYIAYKNKLV